MSKAIVREYVARFNRGDTAELRELYHERARIHDGMRWLALEEVVPLWEQAIDGLGVDLDIERIISEEEAVALLYTERGWSRAAYLGQPATGRSYELASVDWFVIEEGRIASQWSIRDRASMALQLGWEQPQGSVVEDARVA